MTIDSSKAQTQAPLEEALAYIRGAGWSVAVHNDYRIGGATFTFWLFTHPDGRWLKGEGSTDRDALASVLLKIPVTATRASVQG